MRTSPAWMRFKMSSFMCGLCAIVFVHDFAERLLRPLEADADGPDRYLDNISDLFVAEIFEVVKDEHFLIARRDLLEPRLDHLEHLGALALFFHRIVVDRVRDERIEIKRYVRSARGFAQLAHEFVVRDAVDPG